MTLPALHVDSSGIVRDSNNKQVYLRGLNTGGTEYGNGFGGQSQAWINSMSQLSNSNLWRIAVNASWWNANSAIPSGWTYQNWIAQLITWANYAGLYAEISCVTAFCTTTGNPPQNFLDSCNSTAGVIDATKIQPIFNTFWTNFVPLYSSNPGVLYNLQNEPTWQSDAVTSNQSLLTTVRGLDSTKIVIIDSRNYANIVSGADSQYSPNSNLILDWHIYDFAGDWWYDKFYANDYKTNGVYWWNFAQAAGQAAMLGEWNSPNAILTQNITPYTTEVVRRCLTYNWAHAFYYDQNCSSDGGNTLNFYGTTVQGANALIAAGPKAWYGQ